MRTKEEIERLVNLINLSYSAMILLPYCKKSFQEVKGMSTQEILISILYTEPEKNPGLTHI